MKNLYLLVFILITKTAFAQKDTVGLNVPFKNGVINYERVFNASGKSKTVLFDNAQSWFITHYGSANSIESKNDYTGRVIGTGMELMKFKAILGIEMPCDVKLTAQIDCKNGKYRCRVFNIILDMVDVDNKRITITPEDLFIYLAGWKGNPVPFNKNQSKRILQSLNATVNNVMLSINDSLTDDNNF